MTESAAPTPTTRYPIPCTPVDLTRNPNIPELSKMLREASSMTDPARMMKHFGPWISKRSPRSALVSVSKRGLPEGSYKFTRVVLGDPSTFTENDRRLQDPWADWHNLDTFEGGLIWELIKTPEPKLLNHADFSKDEALRAIMGENVSKLHSVAVIPAYDNGDAINWALIFQKDPDWSDLDMFEAGFLDLNMLGTATRNLVSRRTVEQLNSKLKDQFNQVGRIQRALIPDSNPELSGYSIATYYEPSTMAGGDFYDYFQFPDGRVGLIIADVSGHGAGAATVMAMIAAALRAFAFATEDDLDTAADPAAVATFINKVLITSSLPQMFATAFLCVLDPRTGTIDWVRCGHNPPRIRGVDGSIRSLRPPGTLPLGIDPDLTVPASTSQLAPGETLVLYTDGITEAKRGGTTHDLFGEERLDDALSRCSGEPNCVIHTVTDAVREFTGTRARDDDQTIVVVRNNPE